MFDDPKKNLKRIEEELWAAEYEDEIQEEEHLPEEVFSFRDSDWVLETGMESEEEEPPVRNFANGYGRRRGSDVENFHRTVYADEEMDESNAVLVEKKKKEKKKERKKREKRGSGCMVFLILLELMGIAGIGWWWYRWLT